MGKIYNMIHDEAFHFAFPKELKLLSQRLPLLSVSELFFQ